MAIELNAPPTAPNDSLSARFLCDRCGELAATVTLTGPGARDPLAPPGDARGDIFASVFPTSRSLAVDGPLRITYGGGSAPADGPDQLWLALEAVDPIALAMINPEYASFFCPACRKCYCRSCWRVWTAYDDGFYDATYGRCPEGHYHKMDD